MVAEAKSIARQEGRGSAALWFGLLAAPLAWSVQLVVNYALEEWLACAPGSGTPGAIWGIGTRGWIVGVSAILTVVAVAALVVSVAAYRRLGRSDESTGGRARWMAFAGIINSVVFFFPIALGFAPAALLEACRAS